MVTHELQLECRTGKVRWSQTDVLPPCHTTKGGYEQASSLLFLAFSYASSEIRTYASTLTLQLQFIHFFSASYILLFRGHLKVVINTEC